MCKKSYSHGITTCHYLQYLFSIILKMIKLQGNCYKTLKITCQPVKYSEKYIILQAFIIDHFDNGDSPEHLT